MSRNVNTNFDRNTIESFGDEWLRFDQTKMPESDARRCFENYFSIFSWDCLPKNAEGFDMGCGSGRWARFVAPYVRRLHCIDPSSAIEVAKCNLIDFDNISFIKGSVDDSGLQLGSQDFGYALGVLHHVPDTEAAIRSCVQLLKPGAPLLLYLYYAFDNRPRWFRALWRISDLVRQLIFGLPPALKYWITNLIAALVYWPLARLSLLLERLGFSVSVIPLSYYRHHSFYTMRTDSRDRFGTPLEQRFSRDQIQAMMRKAGLVGIRFSNRAPYWCAVGFKA